MDSGETGVNIIFIAVIVLLMGASIYFRRRKTGKTPLGMVASLFSEVDYNQGITETFGFHWQSGKFKTGSWMMNRDKLDFLPQELLATLSEAFDMAEDFNQRIDAARKYKSDSYMAGIDVDKLKEPLAKSKQELQEWLQENMNNPEYAPKRRGLFG